MANQQTVHRFATMPRCPHPHSRLPPVTPVLSEDAAGTLIEEIMNDERSSDYEIAVPGRDDAFLSIVGRSHSGFSLTPILAAGGRRIELPAREFQVITHDESGIAGATYPSILIVSTDPPGIGVFDWLLSDPWKRPVG